MNTEFNELLPLSSAEKAQLWIIGTREQANDLINECCVKRIASDRFALPDLRAGILPVRICG